MRKTITEAIKLYIINRLNSSIDDRVIPDPVGIRPKETSIRQILDPIYSRRLSEQDSYRHHINGFVVSLRHDKPQTVAAKKCM